MSDIELPGMWETADFEGGETDKCTCPHEEGSYGKLYGISMGTGLIRTDTTKGCPEHDKQK